MQYRWNTNFTLEIEPPQYSHSITVNHLSCDIQMTYFTNLIFFDTNFVLFGFMNTFHSFPMIRWKFYIFMLLKYTKSRLWPLEYLEVRIRGEGLLPPNVKSPRVSNQGSRLHFILLNQLLQDSQSLSFASTVSILEVDIEILKHLSPTGSGNESDCSLSRETILSNLQQTPHHCSGNYNPSSNLRSSSMFPHHTWMQKKT